MSKKVMGRSHLMRTVGMKLTVTMRLMRLTITVAAVIHLRRRTTLTSIGVSTVQHSNLALAKESSDMQKSWQELQPNKKKRKQNRHE